MLDWIPELLGKATSFVPRMVRVPPTHKLVKWPMCKDGVICDNGIHWYWPLFTEIEEVDIRWVSTITYVQSVTLSDGVSVSARGKLVWAPDDVLTLVEQNSDYEDRVSEILLSAVVETLSPCRNEDLKTLEALNFALTVVCRQKLEELGVAVESACFTELVNSPAFRLINDGS